MSSNTQEVSDTGAPPFRWTSLWKSPVINHLNGKSYTLPIFNLNNPYSRNFHLSWLGFFVAFLSWFAFPPLLPEAISTDLKLTTAQIGNSNILALLATFIVRLFIGPLCDRYGPRKTMAALLIVGAIPSGLAGLIKSAEGLYAVRFFIGILGATFVPCQAWTTTFFDKNIVGTANSLVAGWGNLGGGVTFVIMVSLFQSLVNDHLSAHSAWRAAYAIVPVPILFFVAALVLIFGTDCPAGQWSQRHTLPASSIAVRHGHLIALDADERQVIESTMAEKEGGVAAVVYPSDDSALDIDIAVAERLTVGTFVKIILTPYTWLPMLMYMATFGFELVVDANLSNVLYASHSKEEGFGQVRADASIFGFLNLVTRPFGGLLADRIYVRFGVMGKKYLTIIFGFLQGAMALGMGLYEREAYMKQGQAPHLAVQITFIVLMAIFCEMANGASFSLVPHCNPFNNGLMSGLVGSFGNLGGIFYALMFRFQLSSSFSKAWWIAGIFAIGVNVLCVFIPAPPQ